MKQKINRAFCLLCALIILAGTFSGCGTKNISATSSQGQSVSQDSKFNKEGLPIVNEKKTYTIAVQQTSPIKAAAQRDCVIETEKNTNVHIDWIEIPASGWKEKINIMFSTNTLPDAIIGDVDISRNYEQLVALDDYLTQYAPNVTKFFESRPEYRPALKAPDGKIHALPTGDESRPNLIDSQIWINNDWLKKLNLKMPTTLDEYENALIAFRDKDPNGNGKKDEIPFTFEKVWGWANTIENVFGWFGVLENGDHVFVKDNTAVFSALKPGYYDCLKWLHKLYGEGLIDKDAFTISTEQYSSKGSGKDIIGSMAGYNGDTCEVNNGKPGEGRYQGIAILDGPSDNEMVGVNNVTRTGGFVITKKCKSPEVLVRWYDHINSSLEEALKWGRGARNIQWDIVEENGIKKPMFLNLGEDKLKTAGYKSKPEYRNAETFAGQTPSLWRLEYDKSLVYEKGWPYDWKRDVLEKQLKYGVYGLPAGTPLPENSERRALLKVDIDNYLEKFVADSVINGIDDKKWQKHLDTMKSLKADEYLALCQQYVDGLK